MLLFTDLLSIGESMNLAGEFVGVVPYRSRGSAASFVTPFHCVASHRLVLRGPVRFCKLLQDQPIFLSFALAQGVAPQQFPTQPSASLPFVNVGTTTTWPHTMNSRTDSVPDPLLNSPEMAQSNQGDRCSPIAGSRRSFHVCLLLILLCRLVLPTCAKEPNCAIDILHIDRYPAPI